jgi:hypothetical protein
MQLPERWVWRDAPSPWSKRSLDITPISAFLPAVMGQGHVSKALVAYLDELKL